MWRQVNRGWSGHKFVPWLPATFRDLFQSVGVNDCCSDSPMGQSAAVGKTRIVEPAAVHLFKVAHMEVDDL